LINPTPAARSEILGTGKSVGPQNLWDRLSSRSTRGGALKVTGWKVGPP
jgi:hypothetical protein